MIRSPKVILHKNTRTLGHYINIIFITILIKRTKMRPERCRAQDEKCPPALLHKNVQGDSNYLDYANEMRNFYNDLLLNYTRLLNCYKFLELYSQVSWCQNHKIRAAHQQQATTKQTNWLLLGKLKDFKSMPIQFNTTVIVTFM